MILEALAATGDRVTSAIRSASRTTGTTFDFLLRTAIRESSLDPSAAAKTSSARGLYQFIESTWLATVKEEGPKYGLGGYAAAIERGPGGQYFVRDPIARGQILKLREDPAVASVMAGALANRNAAELSGALGRRPNASELYLAHFLGASGAKRLIELQRSNPNASAAAAFPDAARANQSIFFTQEGKPRTAGAVFAALTEHHKGAPAQPPVAAPAAFAQLRPTLPPQAAAVPSRLATVPKVIFEHPVNPGRSAFASEEGPTFQALFRDGEKSPGALSPAVRALWGSGELPRRPLVALDPNVAVPAPIGEPLNLLDHLKPSIARAGRRKV
jgi:hypothetical protein